MDGMPRLPLFQRKSEDGPAVLRDRLEDALALKPGISECGGTGMGESWANEVDSCPRVGRYTTSAE